MGNRMNEVIQKVRANRRAAQRYTAIMLVLALLTTISVSWQLHQVGTAMTTDDEYFCGMEAHVHTDECYTEELICGYEEGEPEKIDAAFGVDPEPAAEPEPEPEEVQEPEQQYEVHHHDDSCYEEVTELTCTEEEHTHSELCVDEETGEYTCGLDEHTHDESCYTTEQKLICGYEEGEEIPVEPAESETSTYEMENTTPVVFDDAESLVVSEPVLHHHTADCYEKVLTCTIPEHEHTLECLADYSADVEDEDDWEKESAGLSSFWNDALIEIAEKQLGYTESAKNFTVDESLGEDMAEAHHYTRYGAWYGNPYGSWDVMFVAFCQHYAGIPKDVIPRRAGLEALRADMDKMGFAYLFEGSEAAAPGDIVTYYNSNGDETIGIVKEIDDTTGTFTVISGAVEGVVAEVTVNPSDITSTICVDAAYAEYAGQIAMSQRWKAKAMTFAVQAATNKLDDYVTKVKIEKKNGENWEDIGAGVKDGDTIKISVDFTTASGAFADGARSITYQLPNAVDLDKGLSERYIYRPDGQTKMGTYSVDENGLVTLTFWDKDSKGEDINLDAEIKGGFWLSAQVDAKKAEDGGEISFPGKSETVKIVSETDIGVKKQGEIVVEDGKTYIDFTVTVSTDKGTGKAVDFKDWINKDNTLKGKYVENSVKIVKKTSKNDTGTEVTGKTPDFKKDPYNGNTDYFEISQLDELKPGESYEITYRYEITDRNADGSGKFSNTASANGKSDSWSTKDKDFSSRVDKSGYFDANTGKMKWTVTVFNPKAGNKVSDRVQTVGATIDGNITIKSGKDQWNVNTDRGTITPNEDKKGFDYTFTGTDLDSCYQFTYETTVPQDATTVKNDVTYDNGDGKWSDSAEPSVSRRDWGIQKNKANHSELEVTESGDKLAYWDATVTIADGWADFTFEDVIKNAKKDGTEVKESHFGYAKELYESIAANIEFEKADGTKIKGLEAAQKAGLKVDIQFYNKKGGTAIDSQNSTEKVGYFTIRVEKNTCTDDLRYMRINPYYTHVVGTDDNGSWEIRNKASVAGKDSETSYTFKKNTGISKLAGPKDGEYKDKYSNGTSGISYDVNGTYIYYRVALYAESFDETVTVTDTLQSELTYDSDDYGTRIHFINNDGGDAGEWWNHQKAACTAKQIGNNLTFTITGLDKAGKTNGIFIMYRVKIEDPEWENDPSLEEKTYLNSVSWNGNTAGTSTKVERDVSHVDKVGKQIENVNGDGTTRVEYAVTINPYAKDLIPNDIKITLTDELTVPSKVEATLDRSTVRLYAPDDLENPLPISMIYALDFSQNGQTYTMKVTIPDDQAFVLKYQYIIKGEKNANKTFDIKNSAKLGTKWSDKYDLNYTNVDGGATAGQGMLTVSKVDSENKALTLPGVVFTLEKWVKVADRSEATGWNEVWDWKPANEQAECTTNAEGQIIFVVGSKDAAGTNYTTIQQDVLYRLVEKTPYPGYELSTKPCYFLWAGEGESIYDAWGKATSYNHPKGDHTIYDDVISKNYSYGNAYEAVITNQRNELTIQKFWLDSNGHEMTNAPQDEITVKLYKYPTTGTKEADSQLVETVTLGNANSWTHTYKGVEAGYYYYIQEVSTGTTYDITYSPNNKLGVETGGILTITNKEKSNAKLYVEKVWKNTEGTTLPESITVELYERDADGSERMVKQGVLTANNGWKCNFDRLDSSKTYYVKEILNDTEYVVSYSNMDGAGNFTPVTPGETIVITNTKQDGSYELPSTGSTGTTPYTAGGALMMGAALVCGYLTKRRRGRRAE